MNVKTVSISKIIILSGIVTAIAYGLYLGMENVVLNALGIIGGYLMKDFEVKNEENTQENEEA